jgi:hypothetical protein
MQSLFQKMILVSVTVLFIAGGTVHAEEKAQPDTKAPAAHEMKSDMMMNCMEGKGEHGKMCDQDCMDKHKGEKSCGKDCKMEKAECEKMMKHEKMKAPKK